MSDPPPRSNGNNDEEESIHPPEKSDETPAETESTPEEMEHEPATSLRSEPPITEVDEESDSKPSASRIVILEERDVPFEEERPPNFSPNFHIEVHHVRRSKRSREVQE